MIDAQTEVRPDASSTRLQKLPVRKGPRPTVGHRPPLGYCSLPVLVAYAQVG
jgi:hypothetical protein